MSQDESKLLRKPSAKLVDGFWYVETESSLSDTTAAIQALKDFHRLNQPRIWRFVARLSVLWIIIFYWAAISALSFLIVGILFKLSPSYFHGALSGYSFPVLFCAMVPSLNLLISIFHRYYQRSKLPPSSEVVFPCIQVIGRHTIVSELPGAKSEWHWTAVSEFIETKGHFFITHAAGYFITIPRSVFLNETDAASFTQLCRTALADASSD